MPKIVIPLTDTQIRTAKPRPDGKPNKLRDGGGLYLEVTPYGSKLWKMKFVQYNGKESILSFGAYPAISLADARQRRTDAKKLQASGIDPGQARRTEKTTRHRKAANTFETVAHAWHTNWRDSVKEGTAKNVLHRLEKDVFPAIGKRPITELKAPELLDMLRQIEKRGAHEMARRQGQVCGQIFRFGIASGICDIDPMPGLRGALKPRTRGHHAAITVDELPDFLKTLSENEADLHAITRIMIRLMLLTFVRTSELAETRWSEIDLENERWVIPWHRMKMGKRKVNPRKVDHHVFLPRQGWALLRKLHPITGGGTYLFPNRNDHTRSSSDHRILEALKRMGYRGKMTGHGFRSLAMGVIKEKLGYRHEVVDRQLAHQSGDAYGEAYDRADFKEERRVMMQQYADYIDSIESGKVIYADFRAAA